MMDVNVACKSLDCPYTVTFYGSLFHEVRDVNDLVRHYLEITIYSSRYQYH